MNNGKVVPGEQAERRSARKVGLPGVSSGFSEAGRSNQQPPAFEGQQQDSQQCRDREYTRLNGPLNTDRIGGVKVILSAA